ncbi:hypothetical protein [Actinacidiphila sp. ITFR-21]|uniref:hypothetical protein n=1 Tax=Actinacidiphila sp. ITFR-21 TaxID=3075199 RepID=UPI00288A3505|nr:hypothetical protein [Streptomyces sp. ITFR-21]WNI15570.1 hypothetical protein RLT57_08540 [Streptomyces sp. ITFR-21]
MATAPMQVSLVKGGTKLPGQDTLTLQVLGTAPALLDGTTKPVVNNSAVPFADLTAAANAYNSLLAALRTRGVIGGA